MTYFHSLNNSGIGGGGSFDPTTITGCTEWLHCDNSDFAGLADSTQIGTTYKWKLPSIAINYWEQATSGNQPKLRTTGGPNGKNYLEFDETDKMDHGNGQSNFLNGSHFTQFNVVRPQRNGNNNGSEFGFNIYTTGGYTGICFFDAGSGVNKFRFYNYDGAYKGVNSTTTYSIGTWYIVETWFDGTTNHIKVNNDTEQTVSTGSPANLAGGGAMMYGGNLNSYTGHAADIAARVTYNVSLNSTDRAYVRSGLGSYYGISV